VQILLTQLPIKRPFMFLSVFALPAKKTKEVKYALKCTKNVNKLHFSYLWETVVLTALTSVRSCTRAKAIESVPYIRHSGMLMNSRSNCMVGFGRVRVKVS